MFLILTLNIDRAHALRKLIDEMASIGRLYPVASEMGHRRTRPARMTDVRMTLNGAVGFAVGTVGPSGSQGGQGGPSAVQRLASHGGVSAMANASRC
jgi:hypothetical protein